MARMKELLIELEQLQADPAFKNLVTEYAEIFGFLPPKDATSLLAFLEAVACIAGAEAGRWAALGNQLLRSPRVASYIQETYYDGLKDGLAYLWGASEVAID